MSVSHLLSKCYSLVFLLTPRALESPALLSRLAIALAAAVRLVIIAQWDFQLPTALTLDPALDAALRTAWADR